MPLKRRILGLTSYFRSAQEKLLPKYDAEKDLVAITQNLKGAYFIVTSPSSPFKTLKELIDYAKLNPDKISFASYGVGSAAHLAFALIEDGTGTKALHVPYKNSALPDVISGVVSVTTEPNGSIIPFIQAGHRVDA